MKSPFSRMRRRDLLLAAGAAVVALPPLVLLNRRYDRDAVGTVEGAIFGTRWRVAFQRAAGDDDEVRELVTGVLEPFDAALSGYRADTEVTRFASLAPGESMPIGPTTVAVLDAASRMSNLSGGAFDITVGPLVDLWGFGPTQRQGLPGEAAVEQLRASTGHEQVVLDMANHRVARRAETTAIDVSGIAKGRAVDAVVAELRHAGIRDVAVEIGGEVRCLGARPDGAPWRIGIERPSPNERKVYRTVAMHDAAMATSGTYRHFQMAGERRLSHAIDPRTGRPVEHGLVAVTVAARETMWADAWSTALLVLGPDAAGRHAEDNGVAALFLVANADGFREYWSTAFEALASNPAFQLPS